MNKGAIQKFAIWARNELIAQVSQRAYQYGIDESGFGDASADTLNGRLLTAEEKSQRQELIKQIKEKGYKQVMEEVAYTWFNRFIALRFMEVNNYLPSHIRVFSDASGAFKPEILNDVLHLDLPRRSFSRRTGSSAIWWKTLSVGFGWKVTPTPSCTTAGNTIWMKPSRSRR